MGKKKKKKKRKKKKKKRAGVEVGKQDETCFFSLSLCSLPPLLPFQSHWGL